MIRKISLFAGTLLTFLGLPGPAAAALITVTFTGQVSTIDPAYDGALGLSSVISGHMTYDNGSVTGTGLEYVYLAADPGSSLVFNLGPYTFTKFDDVDYGGGLFPAVAYYDGALLGLDFVVQNVEQTGRLLDVVDDYFQIFSDSSTQAPLLTGSLQYVTPVPLPAAGWLMLAGGAFLFGVGRTKRHS